MENRKNHVRQNIILAFAASLFALVVTLGGAEAVMRTREKNRNTVPATMAPLYYPHERVRQALVRNSHYYEWVHVNAQGFRGTKDIGPKRPSTLRIITVGESTTFDSNVTSDERTWPVRLEHWIEQNGYPCDVEVFNAGVPGYRVLDSLIKLHTEILQYQPDVVLFYHPHNDLSRTARNPGLEGDDPSRPGEAEYTSPASRWLNRNSMLYAKLRSRIFLKRARETGTGEPTLTEEVISRDVRRYQDELATFLAIAQSRGIRVYIVQAVHVSGGGAQTESDSAIWRIWSRNFPRWKSEDLFALYQRFHEGASETAARFGAPVIPTHDFGLRGAQFYSEGDPIHFSNAGAERMAMNLATAVARLEGGRTCRTGAQTAN